MNKLLRITITSMLLVIDTGLSFLAASLLFQITDWIMIALDISLFCIGLLVIFSGIQIAKGDNMKKVLGGLFRMIGR